MHRTAMTTACLAILLAALYAAPAPSSPANVRGTIELGSISLDEEAGDLAAVQETYNIHDGFAVSRIQLDGQFSPRSFFTLDLQEINLDSRKGAFSYRVPDLVSLTARYDQNRQLFDPAAALSSERKAWRFGARATPNRWLRLSGDYGLQTRDGDRLSFPGGTASVLGNRYDYTLQTGWVEAEAHKGARGLALAYEFSDFSDDLDAAADRQGRIVAVRAFSPCFLWPDRVSHYVRGAYGRQELTESDLDYTLSSFQYVGVVRPHDRFRFKYNFYASRINDAATDLKTDDIRNDFDLTYQHRYGSVFGGYGYTTNDDDRTLTSYDSWRLGTSLGYKRWLRGKISYAERNKTDTEQLTLLKDIEDSRFRASLQAEPIEELALGVSYVDRRREFPLIDVTADGRTVDTFCRVGRPGWGSIEAEYSYSLEEYDDRLAPFDTDSHIVTGRVNLEYVPRLKLSAAVTYLDIGKDLDIEKSILSFEGRYSLLDDYQVSVKYNVYNYDDYILLDRYYTANVVWVNVGYRFSLE
jgi:hypothetical protein